MISWCTQVLIFLLNAGHIASKQVSETFTRETCNCCCVDLKVQIGLCFVTFSAYIHLRDQAARCTLRDWFQSAYYLRDTHCGDIVVRQDMHSDNAVLMEKWGKDILAAGRSDEPAQHCPAAAQTAK